MIDIDVLNEKYSVEGEVGFANLENDLTFITISNKYAEADICLYGAHVTNYKPHRTTDILWMSAESNFEQGKPIRGGIPVCFPWFGLHKTDSDKPQHGFARLMYWDVVEVTSEQNGETWVVLKLESSSQTKEYWPFDFCAEMKIRVGQKLSLTLKVTNKSEEHFDYSCALHSYFNLSSIENIAIKGLANTSYHDQLHSADFTQDEEFLSIKNAETRHYFDTENPCVIYDPVFGRKIRIDKAGSKITTVWNPWEETSKKIDDLEDDGFYTFVCVETVNAFNNEIALAPGESHETTTIIGLEE